MAQAVIIPNADFSNAPDAWSVDVNLTAPNFTSVDVSQASVIFAGPFVPLGPTVWYNNVQYINNYGIWWTLVNSTWTQVADPTTPASLPPAEFKAGVPLFKQPEVVYG